MPENAFLMCRLLSKVEKKASNALDCESFNIDDEVSMEHIQNDYHTIGRASTIDGAIQVADSA